MKTSCCIDQVEYPTAAAARQRPVYHVRDRRLFGWGNDVCLRNPLETNESLAEFLKSRVADFPSRQARNSRTTKWSSSARSNPRPAARRWRSLDDAQVPILHSFGLVRPTQALTEGDFSDLPHKERFRSKPPPEKAIGPTAVPLTSRPNALRATRNPRLLFRIEVVILKRLAERRYPRPTFQDPPRNTPPGQGYSRSRQAETIPSILETQGVRAHRYFSFPNWFTPCLQVHAMMRPEGP